MQEAIKKRVESLKENKLAVSTKLTPQGAEAWEQLSVVLDCNKSVAIETAIFTTLDLINGEKNG